MEKRNIPSGWLEEFNVNVKFIDEQHQYFFRILKELEKNIKEGHCREHASNIYFSLAYYANHFLIQEEIYLKDFNYPKIEQHKEKHLKFISGIVMLKDNFANGNPCICESLLNFMTEYFYEHILGYDVKAVKYLKEEGM